MLIRLWKLQKSVKSSEKIIRKGYLVNGLTTCKKVLKNVNETYFGISVIYIYYLSHLPINITYGIVYAIIF